MLWAEVLVDELARSGVRRAVVSPGSRSAPLALALARDKRLTTSVIVDERSAAYFGLGAAKASGTPVAIVCTSGTAAANFHPAVIEADQAGVPLVVVTADRPPELRDVGANQSIPQVGLYASAVRWSCDLMVPEARPQSVRFLRQSVCRAVAFARAGPVHLNVPFREPLAPIAGDAAGLAAIKADALAWGGRRGGKPFVVVDGPSQAGRTASVPAGLGPHGVIVATARAGDEANLSALAEMARRLGVPLLADGASGLRGRGDVAGFDAFLSSPVLRAALKPDWILHVGAAPTSKSLRAYFEEHADAPRIAVDPSGRAWDDVHAASHVMVGASAAALAASWPAPPDRDARWLQRWRDADAEAAAAAPRETDWEGTIPGILAKARPALLWVGSSLPIRDIERYLTDAGRVRIMSNRGASGIDGVVSSAAGAASAMKGRAIAYLGDLSFVHDLSALAVVKRHAPRLTVVVANNAGGAIFEHLPIAQSLDRPSFERLMATPQKVELAAACAAFKVRHTRIVGTKGLAAALRGPGGVIEVVLDRATAVRRRKEHLAQVVASVEALARRAPPRSGRTAGRNGQAKPKLGRKP
jgi:2-succinyl-5-enolpyruvyl-6-hydroxy-3-cyclohexene-1-carboxylate synthase